MELPIYSKEESSEPIIDHKLNASSMEIDLLNDFETQEYKDSPYSNQSKNCRFTKTLPIHSERSNKLSSPPPVQHNFSLSSMGNSMEDYSINSSKFSVTDSISDKDFFCQSGDSAFSENFSPLPSIPISIDTDLYSKLCEELNVEIVASNKPLQGTHHSQFQLPCPSSQGDRAFISDEGKFLGFLKLSFYFFLLFYYYYYCCYLYRI